MSIQALGLMPLLEVFDMPASLAFYRDVLGFEVVQSAGVDWAMLRLGGAGLMLNTRYEAHERPAIPERGRVAGHADAELFVDCPDVDGAYEYLRSKGVGVERPILTGYGGKQLWVSDPDGFRLCFHSLASG